MSARATIIGFAAAMAVCFKLTSAVAQGSPDYAALIAAPDRSAADRATDARRDPLKLLTFIGARPGMKVLDCPAPRGAFLSWLATRMSSKSE
jgi:predicted methyltransferase